MRSRAPALAVAALIGAYVLVFAAIGIRQHDAFLTHKEDLGQIDQAVWNSLHGRWLVETDDDHQSTRLTDHAEPVLVVSSLVFLLWDDVRALLVWQAVALALGAWPIFLLAREALAGKAHAAWLAVFFALMYLLYPALEAAHLAEFHAAPLAAAPIAFALLFLERRQWGRFALAALCVAAVKEEMALVGVMLGLAGLVVAWRDARTAASGVRDGAGAGAAMRGASARAGKLPMVDGAVGATVGVGKLPTVDGAVGASAGAGQPPVVEGASDASGGSSKPLAAEGAVGASAGASKLPTVEGAREESAGGGKPPLVEGAGDASAGVSKRPAMGGARGPVAAVLRRTRNAGVRPAAVVVGVSLLWFVLATFVIIPRVGAVKYAGGDSIYFQRFGELGATPAAVVRTLLTNPLLVLRIVSEPARLGYLGGLLASAGFLALLAPEVLLVGAPLVGANLLSNFAAQYSGDFHYSAPLAPVFIVAAIYGLRRLRRARVPWLSAATLALALLSVLVYHRVRGYTPLSENFYWPEVSAHAQAFERFAAQVPTDARLSATPPLFPHLSHREFMYVFPVVADAEYVLLDAAGVTDMHPNDFRSAVNGLLTSGKFGVLDSADGYILLKRGAGGNTLPDTFYDVFRAPAPRPQVAVDATFGDAVRMLGYDLLPDPRWHTMQVRYYWQALRPLEDDLRLYPFYHDASGKVIEDPVQRPLVASVWYPPSRWRVGEIIQTVTLPWDVGDAFMLAAGVVHGNDWDRKGRRLALPGGETQIELGTFAWENKTLVRR